MIKLLLFERKERVKSTCNDDNKKTLFKHAENYKMGSFTNAQSLTHRWHYNLFVIHHLKKLSNQ